MNKFFLGAVLSLVISGSAWAGCDPCICGNGGGLPPPTGCGYGPWAGRLVPGADNAQLRAILSQDSVQEQLAASGGLMSVQRIESAGSTSYEFGTFQSQNFGVSNLPVQ